MSDSDTPPLDPAAAPQVPADSPIPATAAPTPKGPGGKERTDKAAVANASKVHRSNGQRMTHAVYEGMWEAYRDGTRHKNQLRALFHVSWETVHKIVEHGYPQFSWPALKDRLVQHEGEQHRLAQARATEEQRLQHDEWAKVRKDNLALAGYTKRLLSVLAQRALPAVQSCVFEKKRKTVDKNGNVTEVTVPANGFELASALARIALSVEVIGKHESFWLGGPTDRHEIMSAPGKIFGLSAADAQYILDHDGALPPHLNEEQILGQVQGLNGTEAAGPKN